VIPVKNPNRVFEELYLGLNFTWESKEPRIANRLLKNKVNEFVLSDNKICYKVENLRRCGIGRGIDNLTNRTKYVVLRLLNM